MSVYRPRVDVCERLWFVDAGIINTSGKHEASHISKITEFSFFIKGNTTIVQRPSIWVIDLTTDTVLNRYEIPERIASSGSGLASITVDVIDCENQTFAYLPDLVNSQIIVFNLEQNHSYRVTHNFFHMNPFEGDYNVDGLRFSWDDAIFSIALSPREKNSTYRLAYFHPMSRFAYQDFDLNLSIALTFLF